MQVASVTQFEPDQVEEYNDLSTYLSIEPANSDIEPEVLAVEQRKDDQIATMLTYLTTGVLPTDERHTRRVISQASLLGIDKGVLYFIDPKRKLKRRAVVPKGEGH